MRKFLYIAAAVAALWPPARSVAQQSSGAELVVRVNPDARVEPQRLALRLRVTPAGATVQTATLDSWVRPMPNQTVHVALVAESLTGPGGAAPLAALRWSGTAVSSTGGGQSANCMSGSFESGGSQELVAGWNRPGKLTCAVAFTLSGVESLPKGDYSGVVTVAVRAE